MTDTEESPTEPLGPIGPVGPSYSERMEEAFPDINEDLEKYRVEEQQKNFMLFFKMIKALNMGRTHHVRINSWKRPEPHRADGSPLTKQSRRRRTEASHKRSKAARLARRVNR